MKKYRRKTRRDKDATVVLKTADLSGWPSRRYVVWGFNNQLKQFRECKKKLEAGKLRCEKAPADKCFYVFVPLSRDQESAEIQIERRVGASKLGGYFHFPDGADLNLLLTEAKSRNLGGGEMATMAEVEVLEDPGYTKKEILALEPAFPNKFDDKNNLPKERQAIADAGASADGSTAEEDPCYITIDGRQIGLSQVKELAERFNKNEAAEALKISSSLFYRILKTIPGASDIEFSYFCRVSNCSLSNRNSFGKGDVGLKNLKVHNLACHRENKTVAETEESAIPARVSIQEISDYDLLEAVRERFLDLKIEIAGLYEDMEAGVRERVLDRVEECTSKVRGLVERNFVLRNKLAKLLSDADGIAKQS